MGAEKTVLLDSRGRYSRKIQQAARLLCELTPGADADSMDERERRIAAICKPYIGYARAA